MTRSRLLALCILLLSARGLQAQAPEELLRQANQLYQQGKVAEARDAYEKVVATGYVNGILYYNLGNAYYKSGNIPRAILNYERAHRLMPDDDDLRHNLQLANLILTDRIEPAPRLFLWDYWDAVKNWFSFQGLTLTVYLGFILIISSGAAVILARTYALRKTAVLMGTGAALFFMFVLSLFIARAKDLDRSDEAIVIVQIVTIKNSPDAKSSDAFVLHGGVKVEVIDRLNDWVKIRLADAKVGWMEAGAAETI